MGTDARVRRVRAWYARLLRLYPASFRDRFGDGMAQTFADLCRERVDSGRGVAALVLWTFAETSIALLTEHLARFRRLTMTSDSTRVLKIVQTGAIALAGVVALGIVAIMILARGTGEDITGVVAPALLLIVASAVVAVVTGARQKRARARGAAR
jgi:hypothetical protein